MSDLFYQDLRKYGEARALTRDHHRDRVHDFKRRQCHLAAIGFWFLLLFSCSERAWFFGPIAVLVFQTAADECRRMRACGRYWQCNRSIEVIGK